MDDNDHSGPCVVAVDCHGPSIPGRVGVPVGMVIAECVRVIARRGEVPVGGMALREVVVRQRGQCRKHEGHQTG